MDSLKYHIAAYIVLLVLASVFATLRAAYTITGRAGAERLRERFPHAKNRITYWAPRWDRLRITLLLWAVLMNAASVTSALMLVIKPGMPWNWLEISGILLLTTLLLTITLNILPQALSAGYADRISILFLPLTALFSWIVWPIAWPLAKLEKRLRKRIISVSDEDDRPTLEDSVRSLVGKQDNKDLEEEEREIIRSVFEFGETVTREIMVPRVDMEGIEDVETIEQCVKHIIHSRYSRFPIFHENLDDIKGCIHVRDILCGLRQNKGSQRIVNVAKAIPFVPESMPINDLLQLLRAEQSQMAIIVDEYGGTAGLVTMEDIIEELVGEIQDEYDDESEKKIKRLSDGSVIIDARMPVDEINDRLNMNIPTSDEYDSIAGFVTCELGRIPRPGEVLEKTEFTITVQSADARRIHSIRLHSTQEPFHKQQCD